MQLNKAIKSRWSPRAFSEKPVTHEMLQLLFEAARWAPSSRNAQPWNYFYAVKGEKEFDEVVGVLTGNNPEWAKHAQALIISVMKTKHDYKNRPNGKALHDVGAASAMMAVQAAEMGLQLHQMGGFDKQKAAEYLQLDIENFEPVTCIAVGFPGETDQLPDDLKQREQKKRIRKEQKEFVKKLGELKR